MAKTIITRAEAKAQELKRYFLGTPCKHSHVCERYVVDCKCVTCVAKLAAVRSRRWDALNPEKVKAKTERWRAANLIKYKESCRLSKEKHQKKYNAEQRQDYAKNPEKYQAAWKRYYNSKREWHLERAVILSHKRRAQKNNSGGIHTAGDLAAILKVQNYRCVYCRADLRSAKRHVDHIQPLFLGGSNDRSNLQYLCAPCNLSKGAKDPLLFAQEQGRLL